MAQAIVFVCDRCGQPRSAELAVDLDRTVTAEDEVVEEAHLDLCVSCLGRALKAALFYIPMTDRRAWFDFVRAR
jgi:hypothetical protein